MKSAAILSTEKNRNKNARSVEKDLNEVDKSIIEDCISKGLSLDVTFLTVTEVRLNKGKPRITLPSVKEYYDSVKELDGNFPVCPFTGREATSMIIVGLLSADDSVKATIAIPVASNIASKLTFSGEKVVNLEEIPSSQRTTFDDVPIMKHFTKIG
jgi:hypothetical protein